MPSPVNDPVEVRRPEVDLTGSWATGSANEPDVRQVVLRPECNTGPAIWLLEQRGDTLRLREIPASFAQGAASPSRPIAAAVEGRVSGMDVTLGTSGARYLLRYDSTSGHLRGTFNGAPFWAARQVVIRPPGCIPPP